MLLVKKINIQKYIFLNILKIISFEYCKENVTTLPRA